MASPDANARLLKAVVAATNDAVIVTSPEGVVLEWNRAAERLYGYSRAEALGRSVAMLNENGALAAFMSLVETAARSGHAEFEKKAVRAGGCVLEVAGTLSAVQDDSGNVVALVCVSRDVIEATSVLVQLQKSQHRLAEAQRIVGIGSWSWDVSTGSVALSEEMRTLLGVQAPEVVATIDGYLDRVHPEDRADVNKAVRSIFDGADGFEQDHRIVRPDGGFVHVRGRGTAERDEEGNVVAIVGTGLDVSATKAAEQALRSQQDELAHLAAVVRSMDDAVIIHLDGVIREWNAAAERLYGYTRDEAVGKPVTMLISPECQTLFDAVRLELAQEGAGRVESVDVRKDGSRFDVAVTVSQVRDDAGHHLGLVSVVRDITDRKSAEAEAAKAARDLSAQAHQLSRLAFRDPLTGLANRALLNDRLAQALRARDRPTTVMLLDLDDFKVVNDVSGHAVGDRLLVKIARRLVTCVRGADTVARLGGDEFAILIQDGGGVVDRAAERVLEELSRPVSIDGRDMVVACSIGIATNDDTREPDELLLRADVAMYAAKAAGKSRFVRFTPEMAEAVRTRTEMESRLRQAVPRGEIVVHYQPIVNVGAESVTRVEALVRWRRDEDLVPPAEFLAAAERSGAIVEIGQEVLRQTCAQLRQWLAGDPIRSVAVNVSARQLGTPDFRDGVLRVLAESGVSAGQLVLEVTETLFLEPDAPLIDRLAALRASGVRVSIDDFGTGYSSLGRLQALPLDSLKIDKSFVDQIGSGSEDLPILTAMIVMAHTLGLDVTAEGVETGVQAERLISLGCDYLQGYHFARPQPATDGTALEDATSAADRRFRAFTGVAAARAKVLVVDDDAVVRGLVRVSLGGTGFDLQEAASGAEGMRLAAQFRPDCLLVDLGLPDADGLDVIATLRADPGLASTAIVVLTGTADRDVKAAAFGAGADDYIVKPILPQHLPTRLRGAIRAGRALRRHSVR